MNINEELALLSKLKKKTFSTSEVLQSSFQDVISALKVEDYVIIENARQKKEFIVFEIESYQNQAFISNESARLMRQMFKDNIYFLMRFESPNITFPEIESILDRAKNDLYWESDVTIRLVKAWEFSLVKTDDTSLEYMKLLHRIIAKDQALEWGVLRTGNVGISGTKYIPPIPTDKSISLLLPKTNDIYDYARSLAKLIKAQPFWDGNKRTSFVYINKLLIDKNFGIFIVSETNINKFNKLLNNYYNNEEELENIAKFIVAECHLTPMNFTR